MSLPTTYSTHFMGLYFLTAVPTPRRQTPWEGPSRYRSHRLKHLQTQVKDHKPYFLEPELWQDAESQGLLAALDVGTA